MQTSPLSKLFNKLGVRSIYKCHLSIDHCATAMSVPQHFGSSSWPTLERRGKGSGMGSTRGLRGIRGLAQRWSTFRTALCALQSLCLSELKVLSKECHRVSSWIANTPLRSSWGTRTTSHCTRAPRSSQTSGACTKWWTGAVTFWLTRVDFKWCHCWILQRWEFHSVDYCFQVYLLERWWRPIFGQITEEGVKFVSPFDGTEMLLTPEESIKCQVHTLHYITLLVHVLSQEVSIYDSPKRCVCNLERHRLRYYDATRRCGQ